MKDLLTRRVPMWWVLLATAGGAVGFAMLSAASGITL